MLLSRWSTNSPRSTTELIRTASDQLSILICNMLVLWPDGGKGKLPPMGHLCKHSQKAPCSLFSFRHSRKQITYPLANMDRITCSTKLQ